MADDENPRTHPQEPGEGADEATDGPKSPRDPRPADADDPTMGGSSDADST